MRGLRIELVAFACRWFLKRWLVFVHGSLDHLHGHGCRFFRIRKDWKPSVVSCGSSFIHVHAQIMLGATDDSELNILAKERYIIPGCVR